MSGRDTMPKIGVFYLTWGMLRDPIAPIERFIRSYQGQAAGIEHELVIIRKGFTSLVDQQQLTSLLASVPHRLVNVDERELDIGAYYAAAQMCSHETMCFLNTYVEILGANWLAKLAANLQRPGVGLVGCSGSYEATQHIGRYDNVPFPNPHLRTNSFMLLRNTLFKVRPRGAFIDKFSTYLFEHQRASLSRRVAALGLQVLVVGNDGRGYAVNDWPRSRTFRQGAQSNLLLADNRTRDYAVATPSEQQALSTLAWGNFANGPVDILQDEDVEAYETVAVVYRTYQQRLPTVVDYQTGSKLLAAGERGFEALLDAVDSQSDKASASKPSEASVRRRAIAFDKEFAMLVSAASQGSRDTVDEIAGLSIRKCGDIIYGDVQETSFSKPSQLIVNGPVGEGIGAASLGGCIFVRRDLLKQLAIDHSSVLTRDVAERVLSRCVAYTYVPFTLSAQPATARDRDELGPSTGGGTLAKSKRPELATLGVVFVAGDSEGIYSSSGSDAAGRLKEICGAAVLIDARGGTHPTAADHARTREENTTRCTTATLIDNLNKCIEGLPASIDTIAILNGSCADVSGDVLASLMTSAQDRNVGIVCPRTIDASNRTAHAGLFLADGGGLEYICRLYGEESCVRYDVLQHARQVTAAAPGCWLFRRSLIELAGRFDASFAAVASQIEFCLRIRCYGLSVVVDGRHTITTYEHDPTLTLDVGTIDALRLKTRYDAMLSAPDEFWIERTMNGSPKSARAVTQVNECGQAL